VRSRMRFAIALAALLLAGPARAADFLTTSDLRLYGCTA
jgi:hypothetical protein